jgi:predicted ATPase
VPQMLSPVLVGRSNAMQTVVRMLDTGGGGAVVVLGEAGIGKSRLVREVVGRAGSGG